MARAVETRKNAGFILLVSIAIIICGLYFAREVLIPIALAVLFTFLLAPAVSWLERIRIPRMVATLMCVAVAVALLWGIGYTVYYELKSLGESLPKYEVELREKFHKIGQHGFFWRKMEREAQAITAPTTKPTTNPSTTTSTPQPKWSPENPLPTRVYPEPPKTLELLKNYAGTIFSPLATAALVLVLVCFMLMSREDLRDRLIRLLGSARLNLTTQALDEASTRISSYLGALSIVNFCYGSLTALGLWLIGKFLGGGQAFPNVLVWAILVGFLRFVPYVGIWIGAGFPLLLAFAVFPGYSVFFATLGMFATLEIIVSQAIEPFWYGSSTGMSALAVLVAAVFWTWLWGPIGLLLSTPMTVILVVMGKYIPQLKFIDILLREEAVLSPEFRLYQRLIAMDQEEAADLARDYLNEKRSLITVYDDLLIPALAMAEHDSHHERATEEQFQFVRQSVRDLTEELSEQFREMLGAASADGQPGDAEHPRAATMLESAKSTVVAAASTVAAVASNVAAAVTGTTRAAEAENPSPDQFRRLPHGCAVNVLCLPARDEADEIVAIMLGQVLEVRGYCTFSPSAAMLASEMVEQVEAKKMDLVCVSAMPPAAVAHARYLCKRLHARYPDIGLLVGLWTMKGDLTKAKARIACSQSVRLITTLRQAHDQIEQLAHPLVIRATASRPAGTPEAGVQTAGAAG
ncbi:MAG TPA: AI-2E family transporter [Tepidisphaeraceae bacterium]|nr:AI-2E family transporter [Tepidisphaeraceae bacterium]